jgi:putative ATP-binding cassette transporter
MLSATIYGVGPIDGGQPRPVITTGRNHRCTAGTLNWDLTLDHLYRLLLRDTDLFTPHFVRLAVLSGLANAAVLAIVNMAVQTSSEGVSSQLRSLLLFGVTIAIYGYSQKRLMVDTCERVEELIGSLRRRLMEAVRNSELFQIERIGKAEIFGNLSRETQVLSQAMPNIIVSVQASILLIASMIYLFFLSKLAFILLATFTTVGAAFHLGRAKQASKHILEAARNDDTLIEGFSDVINGFREVKLNQIKSDQLGEMVTLVSRRSASSRILVHTLNAHDFVLSQLTFFALTGLMVFVVPTFAEVDTKTITMTTTATLFMLGPVGALVGSFPVFNNANAAARQICELEEKLLAGSTARKVIGPLDLFADFSEISLEAQSFSYLATDGEQPFSVGPNSLTIRRGDCIFITGGNGSGKTTFVNLLLTLIPSTNGKIIVDGVGVNDSNVTAYRNLFSAIFSDNHLFKTLYGTAPFDKNEAAELLEEMDILDKVQVVENRFTTTELSGGQRKRLAMVAARLERKPILVLDEWAADQDPAFRTKFYRQIIPTLRTQGYTIIAITHDERFFDVADARYHMEDGKLISMQ